LALTLIAVAIAGCSAGNIDAVELQPGALFEGLIAHWTFDDGAGTTVTDVAGNHDGTSLSETATPWIPGQSGFGGALRFDGTVQSEVQVPMFPQPTASWSVAGWIRASANLTQSGSYATIMSTEIPLAAGPPGGGWQLNLRIGTPSDPLNSISLYQFAYWIGPDASSYSFEECRCFVADQWAHVAGVYDADTQTISIYHNGSLAGSDTQKPGILRGTDTLYFGRWGFDTDRRLIGDVDDFVIYNRALTAPEIKQLASGPLATTPP
jgi:hypothetical protein